MYYYVSVEDVILYKNVKNFTKQIKELNFNANNAADNRLGLH